MNPLEQRALKERLVEEAKQAQQERRSEEVARALAQKPPAAVGRKTPGY